MVENEKENEDLCVILYSYSLRSHILGLFLPIIKNTKNSKNSNNDLIRYSKLIE